MDTASVYLSRAQSRRLDEAAIQQYGLSGAVLMENAGRGCTDVLCQEGIGGSVVVCCGHGNNGGDGFVIARHLDLRGHRVRVLFWGQADQLEGEAAENFRVLQRSGISLVEAGREARGEWVAEQIGEADWIVDALLGTGARGNPRAPIDRVIAVLNDLPPRKFAVDLPSGLDCDTGQPGRPTVRAACTCTFVAPKLGFQNPDAQPFLGEVHVVDIGAPRRLVEAALAEATLGRRG
jgi:NAD(P)H-hydrate epimerase